MNATHSLSGAAAIVGLGITEMGRVYGRSANQLAADATRLALADAELTMDAVDGLLISPGVTRELTLDVQVEMGLRDLSLMSSVQAFGASAGIMVQLASMAVASGMATTVVCVFADAPLIPGKPAGDIYVGPRAPTGWADVRRAAGVGSPTLLYSLAARRHMLTYGTTTENFGSIAVAQRAWAQLNPLALMRDPMTLADHQESRVISDPLRLLDCCMVSNGAIAVIVTSSDRARTLRQPPVSVLGWGQGHPGTSFRSDENFGLVTGATQSGRASLAMAGVTIEDIDIAEIYDCYTYTLLVTLEDYGFCAKGEGGDLVSTPGVLGPEGSLKVNTGGGQLSGYYMWGMTPLSEAVIQARGQAGQRQVSKHDLVMVSGNGGILDHHSTLVLGSAA
ncbi:thiolase family protein [Rhodococcus opacus]|uniref:thiolase family protein n=1 Tax=Rhodococcus opacus TaxID=37919 RepID=UPI002953CB9A|nr:thiolase family protein [Rhodococcus opacus]MDV7089125.1 thiolase family protein [Rhodococcus opacus]